MRLLQSDDSPILALESNSVSKGDLRKLLIVFVIVLAIIQALRGKIMVPAVSLLIFATNLALMAED